MLAHANPLIFSRKVSKNPCNRQIGFLPGIPFRDVLLSHIVEREAYGLESAAADMLYNMNIPYCGFVGILC